MTKINISNMLQRLQEPLTISQSTTTQSNCLNQNAVKSLIRAQQARIRQKSYRARLAAKKKANANSSSTYVVAAAKQPLTRQPTDVPAQAINLPNILNNEENEALDEILHSQALDSDDNEALDELIVELANEEEARQAKLLCSSSASSGQSNPSASSSNSSSSSSSSGSDSETNEDNDASQGDDETWGKSTRLVRNPFAAPATPKATNQPHAGYFTENGLKQQKQKLSALKRRAGLDSRSVSIVTLDRSEVEKYLAKYSTPITSNNVNEPDQDLPDTTMSAKNILKDRSSSRRRSDKPKPDRFTKGREQQNNEEERMEDEQNPGQSEGSGQQREQGAGEQTKGGNKRLREPPRTGNQDNTTTEDSDSDMPNAKQTTPSLTEKLTQVYQRKTKETQSKHDEKRVTPSVEFRIDSTHAGEKVKNASVPLLAPTTLADAPILSLKDLVPEQDVHDLDGQGQPESFKTDRIKFVIVEREMDPEDSGASSKTDRDYEWEIPDRSTFDGVIGEAIDKFTEEDWDRIDYVSFSSVGWNTGVGLFDLGSDKLVQMTMFRDIIRSITRGNKGFESYPKRMLLNRYALTIYFNAAFAFSNAPKLLFFFKKLNGFQGDLTIAKTRFYPDDHPTSKGCKIVACEADQRFLDELYKYPKDHPFSIRYGGNLYVRGGERIDPDDPNAVRPSRPKLIRNAARKFIHSAGEDILNAGQKADNEATRKAREEHARKFVGILYSVFQEVTHVHSTESRGKGPSI